MWTPTEIQTLRNRMNLTRVEFAKLLGVEARTVARWENGTARPTGAADAFLSGLREKLSKDPKQADEILKFLVGAAAVGGLAYLIVKLLDSVSESESGEGSE